MKLLSFLKLLFFLLIFTQSIFTQDAENLTPSDFYSLERQNWVDKISYEMNSEPDSTYDVKFYDINLNIPIDTQFIDGTVSYKLISNKENL